MNPFIYFFATLTSLTTIHAAEIHEVALGINTYLNETQKLPSVGANTFLDLIFNGIFVDKTLLVENIMQNSSVYSVIVCPSKWGKSINLDMLKTFLEIQVNPNGSRIFPISQTSNYQLFVKGEYRTNDYTVKLEKPLLIANSKYRSVVDKHLGRYPVIHLSFAGFSTIPEADHTTKLLQIIIKAFQDHKYMVEFYNDEINNLSRPKERRKTMKENKKQFLAYLKDEEEEQKLLEQSIKFLSKELHESFNKKVIILIDDYEEMFYSKSEDIDVSTLLEHTIKQTVTHFSKVIFTGIVPKSFEKGTTKVYDFLHTPYYPFYGFTEREMKLIYQYYEIPTQQQDKIKYWYGGYKTTDKKAKEEILNPWSVCNYLNSRQLKPYLVDGNIHITYLNTICETSNFQFIFSELITGKSYVIEYSLVSYKIWPTFNLTDMNQALWYLKSVGYLATNVSLNGTTYISRYRIINYEIGIKLQTVFATKLSELFDASSFEMLEKTSTTWQQFLLGDDLKSSDLENSINKFSLSLANMNSSKDIKAIFHTLVMSTVASKELHFVSWQFAGKSDTRPDIVLSSTNRGFIIDIRRAAKNAEGMGMNQTTQYLSTLQKYPQIHDWKDIKFVFVQLMPDTKIQITSTMHQIAIGG